MTNRNYNNGRAFEYRVIRKIEALGWRCIRSAGSHTPIDIIAGKDGKVLGFQCKGASAKLSREAWNSFWWCCKEFGCTPILVRRGMEFVQLTGPYTVENKLPDAIKISIK